VQRQLLDVRRAKYGAASSETAASMQNLAAALAKLDRSEEATAFARQAHEDFLDALGPGYWQSALPLLTLAEIHLNQREWARAAAAATKAVEMLTQSLPTGHFITAVAEGRLGRARAGEGRYADAEVLLRRSLAMLEASEADTERFRAEMRTALAGISERTGNPQVPRVPLPTPALRVIERPAPPIPVAPMSHLRRSRAGRLVDS
jgi:tetratricopeptide (TPR) repeat protein